MSRPQTDARKDYIVPPCREEVEILYEDEHLLLVNKPSGLLSVPGKHPANRDCLIGRLQQRWPEARIVHRLDLDTSGIMVVALSAEVHRRLSRQFEQRLVDKAYAATVFGVITETGLCVDLPLICDWPNRPKQKVDLQQGKTAQTHIDVLARYADRSFCRLRPVTGRSHQLRVHLSAIGHPILGCDFYAHPQALALSDRLLLHAMDLQFRHPVSGLWLAGHSPCPFN